MSCIAQSAEEETEIFLKLLFLPYKLQGLAICDSFQLLTSPVANRSVLVKTNNNISMSAHLQIKERVHEMFKVVLVLYITEIAEDCNSCIAQ